MKPDMTQILIVDDNQEFRKALKSLILSRYSLASCFEAGSHWAAFEQMDQCIPDTIFLDIFIPGQDGFEFIEKTRMVCPAALIISMSYENTAEYEAAAKKRGANYHVSKNSLSLDSIDEMIKSLIPHAEDYIVANRRKHIRYRSKDMVFVSLKSDYKEKWGKLIDISEGGLSLCYHAANNTNGDYTQLGIYPFNSEFSIENVHFRTVTDIDVTDLQENGSKNLRRKGLQFQNLAAVQKADINYFTENYSQGLA